MNVRQMNQCNIPNLSLTLQCQQMSDLTVYATIPRATRILHVSVLQANVRSVSVVLHTLSGEPSLQYATICL